MKEALKLALELKNSASAYWTEKEISIIEKLIDALAQPEQEPVAWMTPDGEGFRIRFSPPTNEVPLGWDALYTTPPKRPWVELTDEEIEGAIDDGFAFGLDDGNVSNEYVIRYARAIEQALKEKNT